MFRTPFASLVALLFAAACAAGEPAPGGVRVVPELAADPSGEADGLIDFGTQVAGEQTTFTLAIENLGAAPLALDRLPLLPPFSVDPAAPATVAPGATHAITLRFAPLQPGTWQQLLPLAMGDTTRWIRLRGDAIAAPPGACVLDVAAKDLAFGDVGERATASAALALRNTSAYACTARLHVEGEGFSAPPTLELPPGETVDLVVTARPAAPGPMAATLYVESPGVDAIAVGLTATAVSRCLRGPTQMLFGTVEEGCWSDQAAVALRNVCDHPVRLLRLGFAREAQGAEFRITSRPLLPATIAPGASATVALQYTPVGSAASAATLVAEDDAAAALAVPLSGDVLPRDPLIATDWQGTRPDADRLYVVDDGTEMALVAEQVAAWGAAELPAIRTLDPRVGITTGSRVATPGCAGSGPDGRLVPVDGSAPRVLDRLELLDGRLAGRLAIPACSAAPNEAFAAAERAVALASLHDDPDHPEPADGNVGLRRSGVPLQIVFVATRDDASPGALKTWIERFATLQSEYDLSFAAILGSGGCGELPLGHRIEGLVRALGGRIQLVCGEPHPLSWDATTPFWPWATRFFLREGPLDRDHDGTITEAGDGFAVFVDGVRLPQLTDAGERRWEVLPHLPAVDFAPAHAPEEGQRLVFRYLPDCDS